MLDSLLQFMVTEHHGGRHGSHNLLLLLPISAFAVGCVMGSFSRFVMSSSWWNLYLAVVLSYVTIRWYHLFVDPIMVHWADVLYGTTTTTTTTTGTGMSTTATKIGTSNGSGRDSFRVSQTPSVGSSLQEVGRSSRRTNKDMSVVRNLKRIDERGEIILDDDDEGLDVDLDDDDVTTMDATGAKVADGQVNNPQHQQQQPVDMSGSYQLVKSDNFDSFLVAQGVPWMLARAADTARPIHRITHIGKFLTIKIEGLIESSTTYIINGPPIECLIRGRLFADQVTYLTYKDLGLSGRDDGDGDGDGDDDNNNDVGDDPMGGLASDFGRTSPTSPTGSPRRSTHGMVVPTTRRRSRSLDSDVPATTITNAITSASTTATTMATAVAATTGTNLASSSSSSTITPYHMMFDDMMSLELINTTLGDFEKATTDLKKSFDDMIVKPLNETIDGITAGVAIQMNYSDDGPDTSVPSKGCLGPKDGDVDNTQQHQQPLQKSVTTDDGEELLPRLEQQETTDEVRSKPTTDTMQEHKYPIPSTMVVVRNNEDGNDEVEDGRITKTSPPTPTTPHGSDICGIKTIKRAIHDGNTVTVSRRLLKDRSQIIMTSRVEFDDPHKESVEAKQIFLRLDE